MTVENEWKEAVFSPELIEYFEGISAECGCVVRLVPDERVAVISQTNAELRNSGSQDHIHIAVAHSKGKPSPALERAIAHEVTHALLRRARGYSNLVVFKRDVCEGKRHTLQFSITMVDDVPVNRIIQDAGFPPLPEGPNSRVENMATTFGLSDPDAI